MRKLIFCRESRLGQRVSPKLENLSRLGELLSPGRDLVQWWIKSPGRTLTQAKLARLDEKSSRSGESSSPRRGFAQLTGVSFWYFRLGETNSPRRNYQEILPVLHMQARSRTSPTQFHTPTVSNIN